MKNLMKILAGIWTLVLFAAIGWRFLPADYHLEIWLCLGLLAPAATLIVLGVKNATPGDEEWTVAQAVMATRQLAFIIVSTILVFIAPGANFLANVSDDYGWLIYVILLALVAGGSTFFLLNKIFSVTIPENFGGILSRRGRKQTDGEIREGTYSIATLRGLGFDIPTSRIVGLSQDFEVRVTFLDGFDATIDFSVSYALEDFVVYFGFEHPKDPQDDPENDGVLSLMNEVVENAARQFFSAIGFREAREAGNDFRTNILSLLRPNTDTWGIKIENVQLGEVVLGKEAQEALTADARAQEEARAAKTRADALRQAVESILETLRAAGVDTQTISGPDLLNQAQTLLAAGGPQAITITGGGSSASPVIGLTPRERR